MKNKNALSTFFGALILFATIAVAVTVGIYAYLYVSSKTEDNLVIAVTVLLVIAFLALICTLIDVIRRKVMVETPTQKILEATQKIASGDFSIKLTPRHNYSNYDQFDAIMENLNLMAAELKKSEVLKTDFISNVSHEIKTPLSVIQNYVLLLEDNNLSKKDKKEYLTAVYAATKRLTNLVSDVLKLNKLENQKIIAEKERFNLLQSLEECILQFENLIEVKNLQIELDLDDVFVYAPRGHLEIVWNNLLSNAVKFTPDGGKIKVALSVSEKNAVVTVSDTGCGIPKEVGMHVFDKFYQGDTSRSSEGNGLGLALVKRVIDVLGGEISVQSQLGKGTAFTVVLKNIVI